MANDNNQPGANLANGSVIFVALLATGAYVFHREAPLLDSRPAETGIHEQAAPQTIVARLWQDPFEAVKALDGKPDPNAQCQQPQSPPCESPLKGSVETLVLGVTVPGLPYQEDAERRRRTRYAVLAGLERARFVPTDARHIKFFVWKQSPASLVTVPYERFEKDSQSGQVKVKGGPKSILVLWLREDSLRSEPLAQFASLIKVLAIDSYKHNSIKIIGPTSSDILHAMVVETQKCNYHFCDDNKNKKNKWPELKNIAFHEYGARECNDIFYDDNENKKNKWPELKNIAFYAYGASAADDQILETPLCNPYETVHDYFAQFDIDVQRTVATDDTLADGIVSELKRRGVNPKKDRVALISEWDTFYGRTVPAAVERKFAPDDPRQIFKFTYLRGLDGLLPSAEGKEDKQEQDKATTSGEKQGSTNFFKVAKDTQILERPIGQSQFDYLRRLSEHLHKINDGLRKAGHGIKAIGILSGDVFDKLLILRALRPEFPEALFFTTDFDEAFTIKSELPFTRNLIISSSFGPNLSDWLQGDIPFFRDTYETSAFLATQLAIGLAKTKNSDISNQLLAPRIFEVKRSGEILPFAWEVRVPLPQNHDGVAVSGLTVGHSKWPCWKGDGLSNCVQPTFLATQLAMVPSPQNHGGEFTDSLTEERSESEGRSEWPCLKGHDRINCYIQPVDQEELKKLHDPNDPKAIEKLFPTLEETDRNKLAWALAGGALFGLGLLCFRKVRRCAWVEVCLVVLGLAVGARTCVFWETFAQFLTETGKGEPIVMLQGVSVWPTVLLRILGIILAGYFIWRATSSLHDNLVEISDDMQLDPSDKIASFFPYIVHEIAGVFRDKRSFSISHFAWNKIWSVFDFSLGDDQAHPKPSVNVQAYFGQEQSWRRFVRASVYTSIMFLIFYIVIIPLFGKPTFPSRSELAASAYWWTAYLDVGLMLFLTFFVFDATCFCLLFVNKLRRAQTVWPAETISVYEGHLRLQAKSVHDWIDLEFVAKRTRCIGSLIYYPFMLIALLIVSRSTVFANYAPCPTILIAQGISLCVVFGCAIMLCWAAKKARDMARENLTVGIIHAKGSDGDSRFAEQLESLLRRVNQLKEGAFSPFSQQPLVRAVLLPFGTFGWTALIDNGMLPGL